MLDTIEKPVTKSLELEPISVENEITNLEGLKWGILASHENGAKNKIMGLAMHEVQTEDGHSAIFPQVDFLDLDKSELRTLDAVVTLEKRIGNLTNRLVLAA